MEELSLALRLGFVKLGRKQKVRKTKFITAKTSGADVHRSSGGLVLNSPLSRSASGRSCFAPMHAPPLHLLCVAGDLALNRRSIRSYGTGLSQKLGANLYPDTGSVLIETAKPLPHRMGHARSSNRDAY